MSAQIDGVPFTAGCVVAVAARLSSTLVSLQLIGSNNNSSDPNFQSLGIVIGYPSVGTSTVGPPIPGLFAEFVTAQGVWGTDQSGTLTISTLTATGASGTFAFTLTSGTTKTIADGVFNVTF
jgi:hypothetical protein